VTVVSALILVVDPQSFSGIEGCVLHLIPMDSFQSAGLFQDTHGNCLIAVNLEQQKEVQTISHNCT
jgi:hypothetical protein